MNRPLHLVDPDFDAQLLAERDRLAAEYDRRPDLFRCLAELPMRSHEPVRDFAERRAAVTIWRQAFDIVCWTGVAVLLVGLASWLLP